MKLIEYTPTHKQQFTDLNRAWVEKYFTLEPMDEILLSNPEETILKPGGRIYFLENQEQIIGTVALIFVSPGVYELAKMTIREDCRGLGAGKYLCQKAIDKAQELNAEKLILFTNSKLQKAIGIYRKLGFKEVPLGGQEYVRADVKMELLLKNPPPTRWFDRTFEFNLKADQLFELIVRLEKTHSQIKNIIRQATEHELNFQPEAKWSIKEHIGHLWLLEPLWQTRCMEINDGKENMSSADLNNTATNHALFNQYPVEQIINQFEKERQKTITILKSINKNHYNHSLIHPRLNQPIRIVDLAYFISEHDKHHVNAVLRNIEIARSLAS